MGVYMKKTWAVLAAFILTLAVSAFASELSFQGTAPLSANDSTMGLGIFCGPGPDGAINTSTQTIEIFWRNSIADALDWGITLAPMSATGFPGTPDLVFDTKTRLIKGSGIFPSLTIGVNLIKFEALDTTNLEFHPVYLDAGRLGLSWKYSTVGTDSDGRPQGEVNTNSVYAGVNITPGSSALGTRYYIGWKLGSLNIMMIYTDKVNSAGISYGF